MGAYCQRGREAKCSEGERIAIELLQLELDADQTWRHERALRNEREPSCPCEGRSRLSLFLPRRSLATIPLTDMAVATVSDTPDPKASTASTQPGSSITRSGAEAVT